MNAHDPAPTYTTARYARGMVAVRCHSRDGYKQRAARLAEHLRGRYSNREGAYIMSKTKAAALERLWADGRDADYFGGLLPESPCHTGMGAA